MNWPDLGDSREAQSQVNIRLNRPATTGPVPVEP